MNQIGNFKLGNPYQNSPALLLVEPVPHEHDGRQDVSRQVDASKPVEPIEEESDDKHQVDDFVPQEEEVVEEHPLLLGKPKS